jgi:hypothetical protein
MKRRSGWWGWRSSAFSIPDGPGGGGEFHTIAEMSEMKLAAYAVRTIEDLRGPEGRLEALLNTGAKDARYAELV